MPYQGDTHPGPARFTTDFSYLKKFPGALILVQLICCTFAFLLALSGTVSWAVRKGHGFFTLVVFLSVMSCTCWLLIRVLHLDAMFKQTINWNIAGLAHNGINALLVMVGSCVMLEVASGARTLNAAGVFGFLGFSAFLSGLVWEAIVWRTNKDSDVEFQQATVIRGSGRSQTPDSEGSTGVAAAAEEGDEHVSFVGIKPRPVSSFLEQQSGSTKQEASSPMLVVPQDDSEDGSSHRSSRASSTQGEWQMATSYPA